MDPNAAYERLQEIIKLVAGRSTDPEQSLDLLEEGVSLAHRLTKEGQTEEAPRE